MTGAGANEVAVIVPLKSFRSAKARLSGVLDPQHRAELARTMAGAVVAAAGELRVLVATDDDEVARWAAAQDCEVVHTIGLDLDGSVGAALETARAGGATFALVVHGDLPLADDLGPLAAELGPGKLVLVTDRSGDGTNVLGVPLGTAPDAPFEVAYGVGSAQRHRSRATQRGWEVVTPDAPAFAHDIDTPDDLEQLP